MTTQPTSVIVTRTFYSIRHRLDGQLNPWPFEYATITQAMEAAEKRGRDLGLPVIRIDEPKQSIDLQKTDAVYVIVKRVTETAQPIY